MKYRDFQDYLFFIFEREEPGNAYMSHDNPEVFDNWLCELEPEQWLKYGDDYNKEIMFDLKTVNNAIDNLYPYWVKQSKRGDKMKITALQTAYARLDAIRRAQRRMLDPDGNYPLNEYKYEYQQLIEAELDQMNHIKRMENWKNNEGWAIA